MYKENNTKLAKVSIYLLEKYRYDTNKYLICNADSPHFTSILGFVCINPLVNKASTSITKSLNTDLSQCDTGNWQ